MADSQAFKDLRPLHGMAEDRLYVAAGPCSAESRTQVMTTATALSRMGIRVFRAGLWKPRTKPGSFEGVGAEGLEWLREVKEATGMLVATEVAAAGHVAAAVAAGIDVLWLGARTTSNPFAVQEIADALTGHDEVTVLVKNPISPDIELWIGALERVYNAGIRRLGAVHRGFGSYHNQVYRNAPEWIVPVELRRRHPEVPLLCDPSHIGGRRDLIAPLSQQAIDMGFDGLIVECHCDPVNALSDSFQQVTPEQLAQILQGLKLRTHSQGNEYLDELRKEIDGCDSELLQVLRRRMEVCRMIGEYKKEHSMQVVNTERFNDLLAHKLKRAGELGLSPDYVEKIMTLIHQESISEQIKILRNQ